MNNFPFGRRLWGLISACFLLLVGGDAFGLEILASDRATHSVKRFDATTGAFKGYLVTPNSGGLIAPTSMTIGYGGDLFVTSIDGSTGNAQILRFDGTSGAFEGVYADTGVNEILGSVLYSPTTNTILAGSLGNGLGTSNVVYQFDSGGTQTTNLVTGNPTGRTGLTFGPNGNLYVSTFFDGTVSPFVQSGVLEFDTANSFNPLGYAVNPDTQGLPADLVGAGGLLFDANGDLLVAGTVGQSVVKFDMPSAVGGTFQTDPFIAYPSGLLIAPDGNLLVTSLGNDNPADPVYGAFLFPGSIFKLDINTGNTIPGPLTPFITIGASFQPTALLLVDDLPVVSLVPEPASLAILAAGSMLLFGRRMRRRSVPQGRQAAR